MLLVVAASSGSSPGRRGYKMAVGADGKLCGSIGGGVMEVNLVEQSRALLSAAPAGAPSVTPMLIEQEHRKNSEHPSGMICSGRQTVILRTLGPNEMETVMDLIADLQRGEEPRLVITEAEFKTAAARTEPQNCPLPCYERIDETFRYVEKLGPKNEIYIIGGGHCALALSELMSKLDFRISIFDDRPDLNTIEKNRFAHEIRIIEGYENIGDLIPSGSNIYVVVMTLGYASDENAIRQLADRSFKYFGVLGSKAKMQTLIKNLRNEGFDAEKLESIHTPIGLPINSHTPEEIAVSIASEIILIKNSTS